MNTLLIAVLFMGAAVRAAPDSDADHHHRYATAYPNYYYQPSSYYYPSAGAYSSNLYNYNYLPYYLRARRSPDHHFRYEDDDVDDVFGDDDNGVFDQDEDHDSTNLVSPIISYRLPYHRAAPYTYGYLSKPFSYLYPSAFSPVYYGTGRRLFRRDADALTPELLGAILGLNVNNYDRYDNHHHHHGDYDYHHNHYDNDYGYGFKRRGGNRRRGGGFRRNNFRRNRFGNNRNGGITLQFRI